jgi:hypothetical protein
MLVAVVALPLLVAVNERQMQRATLAACGPEPAHSFSTPTRDHQSYNCFNHPHRHDKPANPHKYPRN